jgi:hydrogenase-4 component E
MDMLTDTVMLLLIVTNLLLLGFSQLRSCIRAVAFQGVALGTLPLLSHQGGFAFSAALLSVITIGLKGVVFPRLLLGALRDADVRNEVDPFVGHGASMAVGFFSLPAAAWISSRLPAFSGAFSSLACLVSFSMVFVGLFVIVSRRKAISQILGYLVLENGMYVFGVVMLRETPFLVDLGVLLDAFAAVFVMGVAVHHIHLEFDHMDVDQLDMLKG